MKMLDAIEILRKDNHSYLWNLPKNKWEAIDYHNLDRIRQSLPYSNKKKMVDDYVGLSEKSAKMQQEQHHRMKKIRRKSDGKVFNGLIQLCRETGINRTSMSRSLNHHPNAVQKYIDEYEFVND